MEVAYSLTITGLRKAPYLKDSDHKDVITKVECNLEITKTDDNTKLNNNFVVDLDISDLSSFVELSSIDEATVISWVEVSAIYEEQKQKLYNQLNDVFYPTNEPVKSLEWVNVTTAIKRLRELEQQVFLINQSIQSIKNQNGITE